MPHIMDWPKYWFNNLFLDMWHLTDILPSTITQSSHAPPLPACFSSYLQGGWMEDTFHGELLHIPIGEFKMINHIPNLIPLWMPHDIHSHDGFALAWWFGSGQNYQQQDADRNSGAMTAEVHAFFKNLWLVNESLIRTFIDHVQSNSIANFILHLQHMEFGNIDQADELGHGAFVL
ncbi:hypothetical protein BKA83DRAFT_4492206 [Pisolithus microcarpus]|nr:hypothetical protein BKA83DRAFT_4492206 [Pisolithus microcarpus]